jgi:PEP-CTERM motif
MKRVGITAWASAFGVALMLLAAPPKGWTQSTIVFVTPSVPIYYGPVGDGTQRNLDLNGDGITDLTLFFDIGGADLIPSGSNSVIVIPEVTDVGVNPWVAPLNPGDTVSATPSSLDPVLQWYNPQIHTGGNPAVGAQAVFDGQLVYEGYWSGRDAFVGLRFEVGGGLHYGWMEIRNDPNIASGQVLGWAYETRLDTPILAGAVPEPSTWALLSAGGILFWLLRRRKRMA